MKTANLLELKERDAVTRQLFDLLATRTPRFLFGGSLKGLLPVFHFHEVAPEHLEPRLRYLADNGYRTVTSQAITRLVREGVDPGPKRVALCFDDAWASLWTVAAPLLEKYGLTAIAYAIPGRIEDADQIRPTLAGGVINPAGADRSGTPFVTWPELAALHASGRIDVQSHTFTHAQVFVSAQLNGFVTPGYSQRSLLSRPLVSTSDPPRFLTPGDLGAPLYAQRSRMSDAFRFFPMEAMRERCQEYVAERGGTAFFNRPSWQKELRALAVQVEAGATPVYEDDKQRQRAILADLVRARETLEARLGMGSIRQVCFPWSIAGEEAVRAARQAGYETAFSDAVFGLRAVRAGDHPYRLMRLKNDYIFGLPGTGRRYYLPVRNLTGQIAGGVEKRWRAIGRKAVR